MSSRISGFSQRKLRGFCFHALMVTLYFFIAERRVIIIGEENNAKSKLPTVQLTLLLSIHDCLFVCTESYFLKAKITKGAVTLIYMQ